MAEFTANEVQTVAAGQNVLFTETPVCGTNSIQHRDGSGIVTLRGITNQCRARYRVSFGANIAIPTVGTVEPISLSIAISGEPLASAKAIVTPASVDQYFNVFVAVFIEVPRGCCLTIAVENTSTQPINVQNANMIAERVA